MSSLTIHTSKNTSVQFNKLFVDTVFCEMLVETLSGRRNSSVRNFGLHETCNYIISNSVTHLQKM